MWNVLKQLGLWTTVLRWREPRFYRIRLRGDLIFRLAIAFGTGCFAMAALLILFAINVNPPAPWYALFGLLIGGGLAAAFLLGGGANATGSIRVCEEGIVCNRLSGSFPHLRIEELSWPYSAMGQMTIVRGEDVGQPFSLLFVSDASNLEIVGVPRQIDLQHLAAVIGGRGVDVRSAAAIPAEYTRPLNWTVATALLLLGLCVSLSGGIFYVIQAGRRAEDADFDPPWRVPMGNIPQAARPGALRPQFPSGGPRFVDPETPGPAFPGQEPLKTDASNPADEQAVTDGNAHFSDIPGRPLRPGWRGPPIEGPRFGPRFGPRGPRFGPQYGHPGGPSGRPRDLPN